METKITEIITPGDLVLFRSRLYMAVAGKCPKHCDMWDGRVKRCNGYCYRWKGDAGVVFQLIGSEFDIDTEHMTVVQTPDLMGDKIRELMKLAGYRPKGGRI